MGFGGVKRVSIILILSFLVLAPFALSLSFTTSPDVTPNYPTKNNAISCAWISSGATSTTVYWYQDGGLYSIIGSAISPVTIDKRTHDEFEVWECKVSITDGTSTIEESDYVTIATTNVAPVISSIEFNDVGDSGDEVVDLPGSGTTPVRCFGTATDANNNDKIQSIVGVFYSSNAVVGDPDNGADHYTDSSCDYDTATGAYECNADVWYFADSGTWTCQVTVTDEESSNDVDTDTVVFNSAPAPPSVDSIELNDVGDSGDENITLPTSGTHGVRCFGTATDPDGNSDISTIVGKFYASGTLVDDPDNAANHYTNNTCSYVVATGAYECTIDMWYFAQSGTWTCQVSVTDSNPTTVTDTDTVTVYATNSPPVIGSAEFNEMSDTGDNEITLATYGAKQVRCFGTLTDFNGNSDIDSTNATFYHSTSSSSSTDSIYTHYTNNSCSYNTVLGTYECSTWIESNATSGTWYCNVTADDGMDIDSLVDSVTILSGPLPNVTFTTYPEILPAYPVRNEDIVCSWGETADVQSRTVYWYLDGGLYSTVYPGGQSTIMPDRTSNGDVWNCTVVLTGGAYSDTASDVVVVGSSPPSIPPVITTIELNEASDTGDEVLALVAGGIQPIRCFGTATDPDGLGDIVEVFAVFYSPLVTAFSPDANRNHYTNSSCNYDNTTGDYTCATSLLFYADPGSWTCQVTVKDTGNVTDIATDTASVNTMLVMDIPDSTVLDFGEIGAGQSRTSLDYYINFSNKGNVQIDIDVDAWLTGGSSTSTSCMTCDVGTLDVDEMRVSQTFSTYNLYNSLIASGYLRIDANLDRQSTGTEIPTDQLYFGLNIPLATVSGFCTGVISFLGVAG